MRDKQAVVDRFTLRCDVCGFEESQEVRRATSDPAVTLTWQREWRRVDIYSFTSDGVDVCARACAEKRLAQYLDTLFGLPWTP